MNGSKSETALHVNLKEKEMKKMSDMQTMKLWQLTPGGQYGPPHYKSLSSTSLIKGVW